MSIFVSSTTIALGDSSPYISTSCIICTTLHFTFINSLAYKQLWNCSLSFLKVSNEVLLCLNTPKWYSFPTILRSNISLIVKGYKYSTLVKLKYKNPLDKLHNKLERVEHSMEFYQINFCYHFSMSNLIGVFLYFVW